MVSKPRESGKKKNKMETDARDRRRRSHWFPWVVAPFVRSVLTVHYLLDGLRWLSWSECYFGSVCSFLIFRIQEYSTPKIIEVYLFTSRSKRPRKGARIENVIKPRLEATPTPKSDQTLCAWVSRKGRPAPGWNFWSRWGASLFTVTSLYIRL